ncbi:MAG TPA: FAD-binding oxidoreductase [Casimicrobiaceae bacterium]|nr:FAD-binding oxidoreductase [Casimicrobiaceae bacterium]
MTQRDSFDFGIVGAGIAGASVAFELAATHRVLVLERESHVGYHATGRSAALFTETYGNAIIRGLACASRPFLAAPPPGFAQYPLLTPRGLMLIASDQQLQHVEDDMALIAPRVASARVIDADAARALVPVLRPSYVRAAIHEPDAMDIDVHGLHDGFLRGARSRGAVIETDAEVVAIARERSGWTLRTRERTFGVAILIDAAGAWGDIVAGLAGIEPIGLSPLRRTVVTFAPGHGVDVSRWPAVIDIGETFYFKPDAGRILASPADQTPSPPCDAQPEEIDIAVAMDRIGHAADLSARHIERSWAGLRTFARDRTPVVGFDTNDPAFFWLVGQGGYGIKTSPALGRVAASLARGGPMPHDVVAQGISAEALAPARLRNVT